jgi:hypothetical protein
MGQSLPKAVTSIVLEEDVMASEITLARAAEVQIYKDIMRHQKAVPK